MDFVGWPLGLLLCVFASLFGIIGKILLKISHLSNSNRIFGFGILCIVFLNPILASIAYRFAPQSLLAPMAGLSIVWNTLISPKLLHELITFRDVVGATLIFAGCIMVGISGSHKSVVVPLSELKDHFLSLSYVIYLIIFIIIVVFLLAGSWSTILYSRPGKRISRICFASFSGILSGQMYFLSAIMHLLNKNDLNQLFETPLLYVCILGAIGSAGGGLYLLNSALKIYDAVFVIYIYESCYIIAGTVSGICFFQEMSSLTPWHYVVYISSMLQIIIGIHIVSQREEEVICTGSMQKFQDDMMEDDSSSSLITGISPVDRLYGSPRNSSND